MTTHAYVLNTGRTIAPFDRPVTEMKLHGSSLGESQRDSLERLGLHVHAIDHPEQIRHFPALVLDDNLYFTHTALARFLRNARRENDNCQAALRHSLLTEQMVSTFQGETVTDEHGAEHRRYACYHLRRHDASRPMDEQTKLLPIPHRTTKIRYRTARQFEASRRYTVPISLVYMIPIRHWSCLVAANAMGMAGFFYSMLARRPVSCSLLPLKSLLRAGSLRPSLLAGKTYLAGRRCRVHPTAHVEASVLGRSVRIGPHAVVRNCVVGDGTEIRSGSVVEGCSLGNQVIVEPVSVVRGCVGDDGVSLGTRFIQLSVFGRDAVICPASGIADFVFRRTVRVHDEGRMVPSGSRFLGGCVGDGAFLGPGVKVLCGSEIPNGCQLLTSWEAAVHDVTQKLPDDVVRFDRGRKKRKAG